MAKSTAKSRGVASKQRRSTSVPGTVRGFSLQFTRVLVHLLKVNPGDVVCLESFDDVGVERPGGERLAEQSKSYRSRNPLAGRAIELWKTLRNWVDAITDGSLAVQTSQFVIYVPVATPGPIAKAFHDAQSLDDARRAIDLAKTLINQRDDKADATEVAEHMRVAFAAENTVLPELLTRFHIETGAESSDDDVKPLMLAKLVSEDNYGDVVQWAHGWVKREIDKFLESGRPVCILQSVFHNALLTYVRTHDRLNILRSFAGTPDSDHIDSELAYRHYVRQLKLIQLDDVDVLAAVNDFLRAEIDRTEWSARGFITERSLSDFSTELETTWRNKMRRNSITAASEPDHLRGQLVHADCMDHRAAVDGLDTPVHFIRGSLHALADDRTIGWHPRYNELLDAAQVSAATTGGK